MEAVAEGLWGLADYAEKRGEIGKALKCLEAICQSKSSFLPTVEVKTRLRIATLLLKHSHNVNEAKTHLERSQLLLNRIPSSFDLKFRTYSLLSQCYHLVGAIPPQKQILNKALELTLAVSSAAVVPAYQIAGKLWSCNFNSQLANALIIEGDYQNALFALESGFLSAAELQYPELQMFFATSILHVHLMQWGGQSLVEKALDTCDEVWESVPVDKRQQCFGLFFYNDLLHIFYRLRICDYKNASQHVDRLDAAVKTHSQKAAQMQDLANELNALNQSLSRSDLSYRERSTLSAKQALLQEGLGSIPGLASSGFLEPTYFGDAVLVQTDKLFLAPPPIDGEWLPKSACYALVDLMVVILGRPKGFFKECAKRIQSGIHAIQG